MGDGSLLEYSCDYYNSSELNPSKQYICPNGCKDGACIGEAPCTSKFVCEITPSICPVEGKQTKTCKDIQCNASSYSEEIICNPGQCSGCELDAKCLPYGFRTLVNEKPNYCDVDGKFQLQKTTVGGEWSACQNNYECESNICSSGECIELKDVIGQANAVKGFFIKLICKLSNLFNADGYAQCINDYLGGNITEPVVKPTIVCGNTGTSATDKISLDTSARRLYLNDPINAARTSISSAEMPNVLVDGKITSLTGVTYAYTQGLLLGNSSHILFGTSGGDLVDPANYINVGTDATNPLYSYVLMLNKNLDVSDATNIQGQKMTIQGKEYVIGSGSSVTNGIYLYESLCGSTVLNKGETRTFNVKGIVYTIEAVAITDGNTAKITVNGISKTVTRSSSYSFGNIDIYVKDITYEAYAGGVQTIELLVGTNTLFLKSGYTVKKDADLISVPGTMVTLQTNGGLLSGLKIAVSAQKSQFDSIAVGESFIDPVFGGLKVQLVAVSPSSPIYFDVSVSTNPNPIVV